MPDGARMLDAYCVVLVSGWLTCVCMCVFVVVVLLSFKVLGSTATNVILLASVLM